MIRKGGISLLCCFLSWPIILLCLPRKILYSELLRSTAVTLACRRVIHASKSFYQKYSPENAVLDFARAGIILILSLRSIAVTLSLSKGDHAPNSNSSIDKHIGGRSNWLNSHTQISAQSVAYPRLCGQNKLPCQVVWESQVVSSHRLPSQNKCHLFAVQGYYK